MKHIEGLRLMPFDLFYRKNVCKKIGPPTGGGPKEIWEVDAIGLFHFPVQILPEAGSLPFAFDGPGGVGDGPGDGGGGGGVGGGVGGVGGPGGD
jgi:hypothetical protein